MANVYSPLLTIFIFTITRLGAPPSTAWGQNIGDGSGFLCSLNCTFQHASAWASVLSLKNLAKSDLLDWASGAATTTLVPPTTSPDTLDQICRVYGSYNGCLMKCPDDIFRQGVTNSMSAIQTLCANRQDFSANDKDCVQKFTPQIQQVCKVQNELLLSSTKQLQEAKSSSSLFGNFASIFQRLCQNAMDQVTCVGESLHQKCGDGAYDLIKKIFQASLGSVKSLIGDKEGAVPVQCKQLFNSMVTQKNGSIALVFPKDLFPTTTTTLDPVLTTTMTPAVSVVTVVEAGRNDNNMTLRDISNRNLDALDPTGSANGEFFSISRSIILLAVVLFIYVTMEF